MNILLTSAGRRVELTREFGEALRLLELPGRVHVADASPLSAAAYAAHVRHTLPGVLTPEYPESLAALCRRERVDLVVPLIDTELPVLAQCRELVEATGAKLLLPGASTVAIGADKRQFAAFVLQHGLDTPTVLDPDKVLSDNGPWPVFLKPARGSASIGARVVDGPEELRFYLARIREPVLLEFLDGEEFTVDVLCSDRGEPLCIVPRLRIEVRAGEVSKGRTVREPRLIEVSRRLVDALPDASGVLTLQCIRTRAGRLAFIELNARFGGGYPLSYAAGADYPRALLELQTGASPNVVRERLAGWRSGLIMLRYDAAVFVADAQL
ncbi:MAG: ATP-grasp domain-containing protein [Gemmatimonadales bacterium]|jgi:carbamoyl-phosphate synthase large subunit